MKKFKLMQILPSLRSGGVEQGTLDVANYLASLEIKNYICSNGGEMLLYLNKKYVEHFNLPVHSKFFFNIPFLAKKINIILKENKIDILHFRSRAPAWLLPLLNKKNLKTVSTFHNIYGGQNFFKKIYNSQLGRVNRIVAISNYVGREIVNKYEINPDKISVINRGIDTVFFDSNTIQEEDFLKFIRRYNIDLDKKIILFPGRLTSWKGQVEFLKVVEYFKNKPIIFYFIGDDKNKSYLQSLNLNITKKNLRAQCRVLGHFNKEKLKMMYMCSDLVISAPLRPEGFGRTVSESLAMKKIIIAYNVGGVKDQLSSLDNIYKVNNQDINEMTSKISIVLNLDKNQIQNFGNIGRKHIINNFSKKTMLDSYFNFYKDL